MRSLPLSEHRVLRADARMGPGQVTALGEPQRQPSMSQAPRSPVFVDMLPFSGVARDPSSRSNGGATWARELRSSRSESPTARHSVSMTFGAFAPGSSGSFVQPSPIGSSLQNGSVSGSVSSVHVPARNASSLQQVIPAAGRLASGSFSNVLPIPTQADGERKTSSSRFSNVTPTPGTVTAEPAEQLQTRYSTGSYIAAPLAGSMPSQTREANEAVGNAVVSSLQSRLEDVVQNNLQVSQPHQENSFLDAGHATALQNGIENLDDGSEATWTEAVPGGPMPEPGGEEVWIVDEFSMDVYEARARLDERIKAAAGLAILRDALGMESFRYPDDVPMDVPPLTDPAETQGAGDAGAAGWQYDGTSQPPVPTDEAAAREQEAELAATDGVGQEVPLSSADLRPSHPDLERKSSSESFGVTISGEEARPDTAALLPPRVDGLAKDVLMVGDHEMEETWVLIDGLRVRVEMLPGGLLPERDTIFEELNFLLSGLQNWEPGDETHQAMPQFLQLSEMVRFSERVLDLEKHYLGWAEDKDAPPVDLGSKAHVCEWLGEDGEKDTALESLRMAGARRCKGPDAEVGSSCRKLLRHELYKRNAQRCPICKRPSKKSMAEAANKKLAGAEVAALM